MYGISRRQPDRRAGERLRVRVPATIELDHGRYTATVLNIVAGGALIETSAPVAAYASLTLRCGSVCQKAIAIWRHEQRIGLKFLRPLSEGQLGEQASRTAAVDARLGRQT